MYPEGNDRSNPSIDELASFESRPDHNVLKPTGDNETFNGNALAGAMLDEPLDEQGPAAS